jgi:hypothetical protein
MQGFCTDCRRTTDLTTDHSPEAWRRKAQGKPIRLVDVDVVCASCNARRGRQRPGDIPPAGTLKYPRGRQNVDHSPAVNR